MPLIPAWFISVLALLAAVSLFRVKAMPPILRFTLSFCFAYFSCIYAVAESQPSNLASAELVRFGLVGMFVPMITGSLLTARLGRKHP